MIHQLINCFTFTYIDMKTKKTSRERSKVMKNIQYTMKNSLYNGCLKSSYKYSKEVSKINYLS